MMSRQTRGDAPAGDTTLRSGEARLAARSRLATVAAIALAVGLASCNLSIGLTTSASVPTEDATVFQLLAAITAAAVGVGLLSSLTGLAVTRLRGGVFYVLSAGDEPLHPSLGRRPLKASVNSGGIRVWPRLRSDLARSWKYRPDTGG